MATAEKAHNGPKPAVDPGTPVAADSPAAGDLGAPRPPSVLDRLPFWESSLVPATETPLVAGWWVLGYPATLGAEPAITIRIGADTTDNRDLAHLIANALQAESGAGELAQETPRGETDSGVAKAQSTGGGEK